MPCLSCPRWTRAGPTPRRRFAGDVGLPLLFASVPCAAIGLLRYARRRCSASATDEGRYAVEGGILPLQGFGTMGSHHAARGILYCGGNIPRAGPDPFDVSAPWASFCAAAVTAGERGASAICWLARWLACSGWGVEEMSDEMQT